MSRGKKIKDSTIEVVLGLAKAGKSTREISSLLGIGRSTVQAIIQYQSVEGYRDYKAREYDRIKSSQAKNQMTHNYLVLFHASESEKKQILEIIEKETGHKYGVYRITADGGK